MQIHDFIMYVPRNIMAQILKRARINIDDIGKEQILKNGLYHITPNEEITKQILETGYLRPSRKMNSYGTESVSLFNGKPSINEYMPNLADVTIKRNPYLNPTMALSAIKILPKDKSELVNYKCRGLADNVIIYEGYCILPEEEVKSVFLVPDLVRDEMGKPLINTDTGKYEIAFREAKLEELENNNTQYKAPKDYLDFIERERKGIGYLKGTSIIVNTLNKAISIVHEEKLASNIRKENLVKIFPKMVKTKLKQLITPKLDMATDEKIYSIVNQFNHDIKNPYRDGKFALFVANLNSKGVKQLELKSELEKITTSNIGEYFRNKYDQIDKSVIIEKGIHGINHNNRVAILAMIIANNEGILANDMDNKTKDILLYASYYHDIGRKKGIIVDNYGPHSKSSARKTKKMNLTYLNGKKYTQRDKNILLAVIEAHEGEDKDIEKVLKKYDISEKDKEYATMLIKIIKDADALDRVRTDRSKKVDLKPKYLRLDIPKRIT